MNEDESASSFDASSQDSESDVDLSPAQKIDLWKKLQDLMRN